MQSSAIRLQYEIYATPCPFKGRFTIILQFSAKYTVVNATTLWKTVLLSIIKSIEYIDARIIGDLPEGRSAEYSVYTF